MSKRRKLFVTVLIVAVGCTWSLLALYSIVGSKEDSSVYAPNVVYSAPSASVSGGSGPSFYTGPRRSGTLMYRHPAPATYSPAPVAAMRSTSAAPAARVYQTSSATVRSYGGGGTDGGAGSYSHRKSSGTGVNYTAYAYSGAIYLPTRNNAVTAVGAKEVSDVAAQKLGAPRRIRTGNGEGEWPEDPGDPAPDPEPPVPVGDIPCLLMLLLTAAYVLRITLQRKAAVAKC